MTEIKPEIILTSKVWDIIEWFSRRDNFANEIGALCVGECKNGNIYVNELLFPEQNVSAASVTFTAKDWSSIVINEDSEKIKKIIGYWHKHPSGTSPSSTDEEETINVFMSKESGRKVFCFLISAQTYSVNKDIEIEGRIEIRGDINASIEAEINEYRTSKVERLCKKIIKEKIKKYELGDAPEPLLKSDNGMNCSNQSFMVYHELNGHQCTLEKPKTSTIPKSSFDATQINLNAYTHPETYLECTREKNNWKIECGEAFANNYYAEISNMYSEDIINNLQSQTILVGRNTRFLITFEVSTGCKKKFKRLLLKLVESWQKERTKRFDKLTDNKNFTETQTNIDTILAQ